MQHIKYVQLRAGALLLFLGMLTGFLVAGSMTGKISADSKMMLGSHLNAIIGALMLVGYAQSVAYLKYSEKNIARIGYLLVVACYANWLITAVKAVLRVHGIDFTGNGANDLVFAGLGVFVVVPSLVATFFWCVGFQKHKVL